MLGNRTAPLGLDAIERSQFALTNLPGKTLVTSTEQPSLFIRSAHILNAIISGEPMIVERKYEHPYQITPHAKILWAMNDLPRISEANSGLFRRVKIIHFPPRDEPQRDPTIKERVRRETAGILNWALVGLDRLRQQGRFNVPQCVQNATVEFRESNDIPLMFVGEMCLTGPDYRSQAEKLYNAYKQWCIDTGHKPLSSTSLAEDWKRLRFERYRAAGKTFWRGVGLIAPGPP
jgi:putative DNA primase/helicase